mmetsp:Transcript_11639/g.31752  ORF Transcript_11639/g.31752 Transcript_11639/m.31752 type:complete len:304 (-) Transcript_11639:154-1065(-)
MPARRRPKPERQQRQTTPWHTIGWISALSFGTMLLTLYGARVILLDSSQPSDIEQLLDDDDSCVPRDMWKAPTIFGFNMAVLKARDIVSQSILDTGHWDINSTKSFAEGSNETFPANGTFLDLGGNIGVFSMLFAHSNFTVYTVEPLTWNRRAIKASICLNPHLRDRIKVLPVALVAPSDLSMTCIIRPMLGNWGNAYLTCGGPWEMLWETWWCSRCETVAVKTLDQLLAELQPSAIDVAKLDIENFECRVLEGGHSLFKRYRPKFVRVETAYSGVACWAAAAETYGYTLVDQHGDTLLVRRD